MKHKIDLKAIAAGTIVDVVISFIGGFLIGIVGAIYLSSQELPKEEILQWSESSAAHSLALCLGLFSTTIGAYITARRAKQSAILNVLLYGGVIIVLSILLLSLENNPLWFDVASIVLIIPLAYIGGLLAIKKGQS